MKLIYFSGFGVLFQFLILTGIRIHPIILTVANYHLTPIGHVIRPHTR